MLKPNPTAIRFDPETLALIEDLRDKITLDGKATVSAVVRVAVRELHRKLISQPTRGKKNC